MMLRVETSQWKITVTIEETNDRWWWMMLVNSGHLDGSVGATPSHHPLIDGFSMKQTIQLLGCFSGYGNLQMFIKGLPPSTHPAETFGCVCWACWGQKSLLSAPDRRLPPPTTPSELAIVPHQLASFHGHCMGCSWKRLETSDFLRRPCWNLRDQSGSFSFVFICFIECFCWALWALAPIFGHLHWTSGRFLDRRR